MAFIEWTQRYSVGSSEMDEQHRQLFKLTNQLHEAMLAGQGRALLGDALDRLLKYTEQHFSSEEQLMTRVNYAHRGDHIVEHRRLIQQVQELRRKFDCGGVMLSLEVMDFLRDWLNNHILDSDRRYAPHVAALGVQ